MSQRNWFMILAAILAALLMTSAQAFNPSIRPASAQPAVGDGRNWEMINYGPNGGSFSPQTVINRDNVEFLNLKWMFPWPSASAVAEALGRSGGEGSNTPALVVDGIVYTADNLNGVLALDGETGELICRTNPEWDQEAQSAAYPHVRTLGSHTHAINYYRDQGILIPQIKAGQITAFDVGTCEVAWIITELAGTEAESIAWGSQGFYSIGTHPPAIIDDILVVPVTGGSGRGGRTFVAAYDISNPEPVMGKERRLWQTFLMAPSGAPGGPPVDREWAMHECDKGWFFSEPEFRATGRLAVPCSEVLQECRECLLNDWINPVAGLETSGRVHTASTMSNVWGHYPVDPETGIVYMGLGDIGPYMNATYRPGPNLYGSGIVAMDSRTGEMVWWFASNPHDLWDWDCSWGGMLGEVDGRKAYFKACKNGFLYALDAATGEPFWIFDSPNVLRCGEYCLQLDPKNLADMTRPWATCIGGLNAPTCHRGDWLMNPHLAGAIESDFAYDGERIFVAAYNAPSIMHAANVLDFGNTSPRDEVNPRNATVFGIDSNTGEILWDFYIDEAGFRGGISTSGGVVFVPAPDGKLYFLDAESGQLIDQMNFGTPLFILPTIGADDDGDFMLLLQTTTAITAGIIRPGFQGGIPGALMAFNLPSDLAEELAAEEAIAMELEEAREELVAARQEVEAARAETEVAAGAISPISYVIIGVGVVLVVVAGVLFARRRST